MGSEVYHHLKNVIKAKYGQDACNVGDEGGFAPSITSNQEGLDLVVTAIEKAARALACVRVRTVRTVLSLSRSALFPFCLSSLLPRPAPWQRAAGRAAFREAAKSRGGEVPAIGAHSKRSSVRANVGARADGGGGRRGTRGR